jgi:hypothetical protein
LDEWRRPRPNDFTDLPGQLVAHAEVEAAASATDDGGATPTEVLEFLVSLLRYNDNAINSWDDSDLRATVVAALGATKVHCFPPMPT